MKPNFALTLSFDGIGLLHRVPGGWHGLGDVALDAPDLAGQLARLRQRALQLDPAGLRSKLVIPNEQIRYLRLPAPARGTDMAAHVAAALNGTTPYAVADLSFDWVVVGADLHIAAVARETLDEAEGFAAEHRFGPVSFVAIPPPDSFPGEPFFGPTAAASGLIPATDRLMRDTHAIQVIGQVIGPVIGDGLPSEGTMAAPVAPAIPVSGPVSGAIADADVMDSAADAAGRAAAITQAPPAPMPPNGEMLPEAVPLGAPLVQDPAAPPAAARAGAEVGAEVGAEPDPQTPLRRLSVPRFTDESEAESDATGTAEDETTAGDAPMAARQGPLPAFSSRRSRSGGDAGTDPATSAPAATGPAAPPVAATLAAPDPAATDPAATGPAAPPVAAPSVTAPGLVETAPPVDLPPAPAPAAPARPIVAALPPLPAQTPPAPIRPQAQPMAPDLPPLMAGTRGAADAPAAAPPPLRPDPGLRPTAFRSVPVVPEEGAAHRLPLLGPLLARLPGRGPANGDSTADPASQDKGQPRGLSGMRGAIPKALPTSLPIGLPRIRVMILAGALVVVLAVVAAWSAIFTGQDRIAPAETAQMILPETTRMTPSTGSGSTAGAVAEAPPAAIGSGQDAPLIELARLEDGPVLSDLADEMIPPEAAPAADDLPAENLPSETPAAEAPAAQTTPSDAATPEQTGAEALSAYAATGIWQIAPAQPGAPEAGTLDDLYLASIDTSLQNFDAVALPDGSRLADPRPAAQSSPAAPGTSFALDARGLVIATAEGAPTPEGAVVFAGRPAVTPPGMPTRFARTPDANATAGTEATEEAAAPVFAGPRPRPRPETLLENAERAQLGGLTRSELATLRPRPRPATLAAVALALREADAAEAAAAAAAEAEADEADALDGATDLAIANSLKPLARPRNFASLVDTTRQSQQIAPAQQAAPQAQPQAAPQPAPEQVAALAAPRSAAPQIPSSASVAQQATVRGAINLRQVNLIGVYGQPSNRRALVRLSNGRYQKVQVGDRLDGGQVRAIGENELSYVKNNRAIVLTMPRG